MLAGRYKFIRIIGEGQSSVLIAAEVNKIVNYNFDQTHHNIDELENWGLKGLHVGGLTQYIQSKKVYSMAILEAGTPLPAAANKAS